MKRILVVLAAVVTLVLLGMWIRRIIHETIASPVAGQEYVVALGDSVAAGAGLQAGSNRKEPGCDGAATAFPFVLGRQLGKPVEQFACSGATIGNAGSSGDNTVFAQYTSAQPYLAGSNVVVYAGANDIGWLQALTACAQTNCATDATRSMLATKLVPMQRNLTTLLQSIQQAHPRRLVVNT